MPGLYYSLMGAIEMKKFILTILVIALCFFLLACNGSKESIKVTTYRNDEYGISLKYPSSWKPNKAYMPERYEGSDGFFQFVAVAGGQSSIDEVASWDANHKLKPYGSKPTIEKLTISGQEARLIQPSEDQPFEMNGQVGLIIKYPNPIRINEEMYGYFELWSDKEHIRSIGETIKFIR